MNKEKIREITDPSFKGDYKLYNKGRKIILHSIDDDVKIILKLSQRFSPSTIHIQKQKEEPMKLELEEGQVLKRDGMASFSLRRKDNKHEMFVDFSRSTVNIKEKDDILQEIHFDSSDGREHFILYDRGITSMLDISVSSKDSDELKLECTNPYVNMEQTVSYTYGSENITKFTLKD